MTKHTLGPWTIRDAKYAKGIVSEMRFVVECNTNIPEVKNTVALVGYKPNARLIASAPELLEACKMVFDLDCGKKDCRAKSKQVNHDYCIRHNKILQAIAKAEGKQ